jgi:hypothetical protein
MSTYCITAAKPKGAASHLKSEFYTWRKGDDAKWHRVGWQTTSQIVSLMHAGHLVLTAQEAANAISTGAAVEVELRIAKNQTNYPISHMPDQ